jgi:hypothetical protein
MAAKKLWMNGRFSSEEEVGGSLEEEAGGEGSEASEHATLWFFHAARWQAASQKYTSLQREQRAEAPGAEQARQEGTTRGGGRGWSEEETEGMASSAMGAAGIFWSMLCERYGGAKEG